MITYPYVKINLGLDVLRRREDGYHDLETLFVPYHDIHDTLEIIKADEYGDLLADIRAKYDATAGQVVQAVSDDARVMITIARREGVDWNPLDDLTVKAYRLLDADFALGPVKIVLEKTSPVGAGLGGGSADASFALKMLSDIFCLNLDRQALSRYASALGSDCTFFLYDRPMFGSGRGESVPSVPLRERLSYPVENWKDSLSNAFEETVFKKYPVLAEVKRSLYDTGAVYASMSGSGSAFFAIYPRF